MPRYFLHVYDRYGVTIDEDGSDHVDFNSARRYAVNGIRSLISEDASQGVIDLTGALELVDQGGQVLQRIKFAETVVLSPS